MTVLLVQPSELVLVVPTTGPPLGGWYVVLVLRSRASKASRTRP
jgi:hypothetical protein